MSALKQAEQIKPSSRGVGVGGVYASGWGRQWESVEDQRWKQTERERQREALSWVEVRDKISH